MRGTGIRRLLLAAAALALAVAIAIFGIDACRNEKQIAPQGAHRGSASIVAKGPAGPSTLQAQADKSGGLRLEGQVIDEAQQPVAGARVVLVEKNATTTSAEDGSFVFEKLPPHRYRVAAYKEELYAPIATVRLGETSEPVILRMRRGATLTTHVNADDKPLPGARVVMNGSREAVTGIDGSARLGGLGPHFHHVEVTARGYAPATFSMMLGEDPGGTIERTVTLRRGASLSGVVIGPDGKPVADASVDVEAVSDDPSAESWSGRATSDKSGAWQFDALDAGRFLLEASSEVYGPAPNVEVKLDGVTPRTGVVVRVNYGAQIVGTVVDVKGAPVPGCMAYANASMEHGYSERSDAAGRFELLGITAGEYDVFCMTERLASHSVRVSVGIDERVEVRLVVDEASIGGIVVDSKGDPVAEARVRAMPTERLSIAAFGEDTTDARGRFDLGGLPPGEYLVSATWPDQDERRLGNGERILTGSRDVKLVLATPAVLTGRVLLDGKPMPYYGMLVTEKPEFSFIGDPTGVRHRDGRFTVRGVDPGTWGVVLIGPGTARKIIADIKVEAGQTTNLGDIAMERGQRVSGRVLDSSARPVPGAKVTIGMPDTTSDTRMQQWFHGTFETTSDASGAYLFEGIAPPPGRKAKGQIVASHARLGASQPSQLPDGDAVVDLILSPTGGVDGVVEGRNEAHGMVNAKRTNDAQAAAWARVNAAGEFRFDALPPGDYTLSLGARPGHVGASTTVTVIANQRAKATIVAEQKRILLIVKVVGGSCRMITLTAAGGDAPGITDARQGCSQGKAELEVPPGSYRACTEAKVCAPVTVTASPAAQTVELRAE